MTTDDSAAADDTTTGRATIRGAELVHETAGEGPELIWGHGLTSSRAAENEMPLVDWTSVPARVTRYDARGHGESSSTPDPAEYSWESLAVDQLELATHLGIDRYLAGGASMGCATALHAAVQAPDRIRGLVLMIPPTAWETRAAQVDQYAAGAHVVSTRGVEPLIAARAGEAPPDPFVGDEERQALSEARLRAWDTERLARVFRGATTADLPDRGALAEIAVPALILAWTGDPGHPESTARELDRLIPDSVLRLASTPAELNRWTDHISDFVKQTAP